MEDTERTEIDGPTEREDDRRMAKEEVEQRKLE